MRRQGGQSLGRGPLSLRTAGFILLAAATAPACVKDKRKSAGDGPETPDKPVVEEEPIVAGRSEKGLLDVTVDVRDDGMLLRIGRVPEGTTLECDLDNEALRECHDGALFVRPAAGDHKVSVTAYKGSLAVAFGETAEFTVAPVTGISGDRQDAAHPLALAVDDPAFANGAAHTVTKDFVARFKFLRPVDCPTRELSCSYGDQTPAFWTDCDKNAQTYTVPAARLAMGLQYLHVRARCGDEIGPILTWFWYGVPADYKPLMLRAIDDGKGRFVLNPVKADDCPESEQKFECAPATGDEWALCLNGNVFDAPKAGTRVRLSCGSSQGPVHTFNSTP